jgi:hypothetical protein
MTFYKNASRAHRVFRGFVVAFALISVAACAKGRYGPKADTEPPPGPHTLKHLSVAERQQAMERAQVWRPLPTSSLDLVKGPNLGSLRIPSQVTCDFVNPDKPLTGNTPKFICDLGKGDTVKVKYGEKNGEVYAETAGSRLLWALGFQSDVMYPTRVTCRGCPDDPFAASKGAWKKDYAKQAGATKVFYPAVIERAGGSSIETPGYEGWAWPELDKIGNAPGGATRAHLDALKLLAVFIQHSDSKPEQQEIVCADGAKQKGAKGDETCASAWLVIKDLGVTFGKATKLDNSKMNLSDWDSAGIWKDAKQCIGDLPRSFTGSLEDPKISEAGRKFLADQLMKLRDKQIRDLFVVSNVMRRGEQIEVDGKKRPVTVDDWVRVFKKKRVEIASAHCPA